MGVVRHSNFHNVAKQIWHWAEERNVFLYASYIPSKRNSEADRLSRIKNIDTEWELNDEHFNIIINVFGRPNYDLFANKYNTKCQKFFSWMPDSRVIQVNALTVKWTNLNFYAFPPFNLILKTSQKLNGNKQRESWLYQTGLANYGTHYLTNYL